MYDFLVLKSCVLLRIIDLIVVGFCWFGWNVIVEYLLVFYVVVFGDVMYVFGMLWGSVVLSLNGWFWKNCSNVKLGYW